MLISLALQAANNPYASRKLNRMETVSILGILCTQLISLYYLRADAQAGACLGNPATLVVDQAGTTCEAILRRQAEQEAIITAVLVLINLVIILGFLSIVMRSFIVDGRQYLLGSTLRTNDEDSWLAQVRRVVQGQARLTTVPVKAGPVIDDKLGKVAEEEPGFETSEASSEEEEEEKGAPMARPTTGPVWGAQAQGNARRTHAASIRGLMQQVKDVASNPAVQGRQAYTLPTNTSSTLVALGSPTAGAGQGGMPLPKGDVFYHNPLHKVDASVSVRHTSSSSSGCVYRSTAVATFSPVHVGFSQSSWAAQPHSPLAGTWRAQPAVVTVLSTTAALTRASAALTVVSPSEPTVPPPCVLVPEGNRGLHHHTDLQILLKQAQAEIGLLQAQAQGVQAQGEVAYVKPVPRELSARTKLLGSLHAEGEARQAKRAGQAQSLRKARERLERVLTRRHGPCWEEEMKVEEERARARRARRAALAQARHAEGEEEGKEAALTALSPAPSPPQGAASPPSAGVLSWLFLPSPAAEGKTGGKQYQGMPQSAFERVQQQLQRSGLSAGSALSPSPAVRAGPGTPLTLASPSSGTRGGRTPLATPAPAQVRAQLVHVQVAVPIPAITRGGLAVVLAHEREEEKGGDDERGRGSDDAWSD
jgi:hypothetical protein